MVLLALGTDFSVELHMQAFVMLVGVCFNCNEFTLEFEYDGFSLPNQQLTYVCGQLHNRTQKYPRRKVAGKHVNWDVGLVVLTFSGKSEIDLPSNQIDLSDPVPTPPAAAAPHSLPGEL